MATNINSASINNTTGVSGNIVNVGIAANSVFTGTSVNSILTGITASAYNTYPGIGSSAQHSSGITVSNHQSSCISVKNANNQEIVRLNKDGSITWDNGIDIDAAADAFSKSLQLGAERSAGITHGVKQRMRDIVFEELIQLARIKGTLDVTELTYIHSAAKIMDKLKGGYE